MPPTGPLPTWRLPHLGSPVSGPSGPKLALVELGGSSPPPGARCWPSGQACRTSAHSSPRPAAAAWGTRTRLGPAELSATTTHAHTGARAPHKPGRRPHLRCGEASHLQKSCRHKAGCQTPSPWRLLKTSARSRGICHTHAGNMGDQATASTQPPPNAPSRRAPTPRHHHGSSVPSGLQHLWASPLFVTLTF